MSIKFHSAILDLQNSPSRRTDMFNTIIVLQAKLEFRDRSGHARSLGQILLFIHPLANITFIKGRLPTLFFNTDF